MIPCSQTRHCSLNSDFDPEISSGPIFLPAMSPGNLDNLILVANVNVSMPDQSLMGVDYTLREQHSFLSAILYNLSHSPTMHYENGLHRQPNIQSLLVNRDFMLIFQSLLCTNSNP